MFSVEGRLVDVANLDGASDGRRYIGDNILFVLISGQGGVFELEDFRSTPVDSPDRTDIDETLDRLKVAVRLAEDAVFATKKEIEELRARYDLLSKEGRDAYTTELTRLLVENLKNLAQLHASAQRLANNLRAPWENLTL